MSGFSYSLVLFCELLCLGGGRGPVMNKSLSYLICISTVQFFTIFVYISKMDVWTLNFNDYKD